MSKVDLIGLEKHKEPLMQRLQHTGLMEIVEVERPEGDALEAWQQAIRFETESERIEALERELSELSFALRFLDDRLEGDAPHHVEVDEEELARALSRKDEILAIAKRCRDFEAEENEIDSRRHRLDNQIARYLPWLGLDLRLEDLHDTRHVMMRVGSVPKALAADFLHETQQFELAVVRELGEEKEDAYFFVAFHKSLADDARAVSGRYDFNQATFADERGTPEEIMKSLEQKIEGLYRQKALLQDRAEEMAGSRRDLMVLSDALELSLARERAVNRFAASKTAFCLRGWVRDADKEALEAVVADTLPVRQLTFTRPEDDEPFPVYTDNARPVEPFEMVTNLYSVPASDGIDPNNVVAPFHALFLGLMMGDVGYGVLMALGGHLYAKRARGGAKKLAGVIKYAGFASIIWGVLLGSYFGDLGTRLGIPALLLSPMEDPVGMLALSLGLGAVHLFVGLGVKAYMLLRKGKALDALYDVGFWYLLLVGLPLLATPYAGVGRILAGAGALGLVATQGRSKKKLFGKILGGVGSLYGITGYLSDVLSYSRLFALLLSSAVVGMVMNQIAAMVGTNVIGYVFAALIFVAGHAFNLFIGGLGAFVHGSRLIYVEFFSKFFMGGGHAFDPLRKETKYITMKNEEAL